MQPKTGRRVHLSMMVFWALNFPGFFLMPRAWQIIYIALCSIYANFVGHWSGWSAERPTETVDNQKQEA